MSPSPAPTERPDKAAESVVEPGSLSRFKRLASRLFGVDRDAFAGALSADKKEREKRRALARAAPPKRPQKD